MRTLAVVGGGVIGLSAAWRAAGAGWTVTLYDPAVGSGSSWVAGGMLAPLSEGWPGEEAALAFGAASLARWPGFAAELREVTGTDVFVAAQTLTVALDAADAADLRTIADFVNTHDLPAFDPKDISAEGDSLRTGAAEKALASMVDPTSTGAAATTPPGAATTNQPGATAQIPTAAGDVSGRLRLLDRAGVRAVEPGLGRGVRAGLLAVDEPAVDNRALVTALRTACVAVGVEFRAERVERLSDLAHNRILLAAGAASAQLWPGLPVRPVKGEILRLRRRPSAPPPPRRVIRARVHGRPIYLVPRHDGIVLGATQYEVGFDTAVTAASVRDLLTDAESVLPGLGEYEFAEAIAGFRPGSPDNLPLIGHLDDRVLVAAGHGRNGILDTPVTADAVLALLAGAELPAAHAADPRRFPSVAAQTSAAASLYPGGVR
ncbi:FAD-dependent oxidoreductase [Nocardia yunnanensis]|uniref:FAD-dependent oxidoreductase n=1 Tax=Nocardia yunnanensis TaxID=2382165 RepID=A0A386ZJ84_9NOCA|nr:FAD-dependent oxidoreductase [Nocardia yunnanensis]AYF77214.1 FAD-dependent oxidoreductase [Nocardia yunnanensis]